MLFVLDWCWIVYYCVISVSIDSSQGVDEGPEGLRLISDIIRERLDMPMNVLMGANIANEVADGKFCETTIGELL